MKWLFNVSNYQPIFSTVYKNDNITLSNNNLTTKSYRTVRISNELPKGKVSVFKVTLMCTKYFRGNQTYHQTIGITSSRNNDNAFKHDSMTIIKDHCITLMQYGNM